MSYSRCRIEPWMNIDALLATIEERTGTQLKDTRLDRAHHLLSELEKQMPVELLFRKLVEADLASPLWQRIIQAVTVGETYFFRNQIQFNALRDLILPPIITQRRAQNQRYLRLWSAGCATGEEPYSLAMLLRDLIPDWREWSLFILATDINLAMLASASQGQYRATSFRSETPPDIQLRYFQMKEGLFNLDPTVRQMVTFRQHNLIDGRYPALETFTINHDVILCRNVTIYFETKQTREIVSRLHGALRDEGWLIVGHAEPQMHVYDAFHMVQHEGTILYQKRNPARKDQPTPPPATQVVDQVSPIAMPAPVHPEPPTPQIRLASRKTAPLTPPPDNQAMLAEARRAADSEDWAKALALLEKLERSERYNPLFHFVRALVLVQKDMNAALEAIGQALYCDPKFAYGHYWQGELWAQRGAKERAQTAWRRADRALDGIPDDVLIPGEAALTAAMLRELLAYRLGEK